MEGELRGWIPFLLCSSGSSGTWGGHLCVRTALNQGSWVCLPRYPGCVGECEGHGHMPPSSLSG